MKLLTFFCHSVELARLFLQVPLWLVNQHCLKAPSLEVNRSWRSLFVSNMKRTKICWTFCLIQQENPSTCHDSVVINYFIYIVCKHSLNAFSGSNSKLWNHQIATKNIEPEETSSAFYFRVNCGEMRCWSSVLWKTETELMETQSKERKFVLGK